MDKRISTAVYKRDGWQCRNCKSRNGLDPHHVTFQSQGGLDSLDNLLTLCRKCHDGIHRGDIVVELIGRTRDNIFVRFWKRELWSKYQGSKDVREPLLSDGGEDLDSW